ncbi:oxidoreductase [Streptomyces sp. NPDC048409]|uniref:oxidoreductase n=1 Tax=Streptomyces sp. NPDC048409 TaxID=3154723 RepID=UPI003427A975
MSKVWFITGASSGIGRALAEEALARGDRTVVTARRADPLKALEQQHPDAVLAVPADVTDPEAREAAVSAALEQFGRIDVLANVAGGQGAVGAAEELSSGQLRDQLELNFFAAAELTRAVLPSMRVRGSGHILNVTSIAGLTVLAGFSAYGASKFALEGWSEALRSEVEPLGIRVTLVEPGGFRTEFSAGKDVRADARIDAYGPVVDPILEVLRSNDGKQTGDPRKAAQAMITVVDSEQPPLRLLLGADAIGYWETKRNALDADITRWRETGENTAFDQGPAVTS